MSKHYVIITAGGTGTRMGAGIPKQFLKLNGLPVIMHSIYAFADHYKGIEVIVVLPPGFSDTWNALCKEHNFTVEHQLCQGGETRFQSVKNGLGLVKGDGIVAVHDAARPLLTADLIETCFRETSEKGNAIPVIGVRDSVREIAAEENRPLYRDKLRLVQTPQVFRTESLIKAYQQAERSSFTDDASVAESNGITINLVEGEERNIKITTPDDMIIAEALLKAR